MGKTVDVMQKSELLFHSSRKVIKLPSTPLFEKSKNPGLKDPDFRIADPFSRGQQSFRKKKRKENPGKASGSDPALWAGFSGSQ